MLKDWLASLSLGEYYNILFKEGYDKPLSLKVKGGGGGKEGWKRRGGWRVGMLLEKGGKIKLKGGEE